MAGLAKKFCRAWPCSNLVEPGEQFCESHKPKQPKRTDDSFYHTPRWRRFSKWYRTNNPLCAKCLEGGYTKLADLVDHIIEIRDGGAKFDVNNVQSLCLSCSNTKTAHERKKRGQKKIYSY